MTHTATPWEIQDPMGPDAPLWLVEAGKQSYEWRCIAMVCSDADEPDEENPITKEEMADNAAFIAKAVNAHDELVEALEAAISDSPKWGQQARAILTKVQSGNHASANDMSNRT